MSMLGHVLGVHEKVYKATDGRIGHKVLGVPCLLLRTEGRKSGVTRTNGLVYAADGDDYVVVASKGGDPKPPAWLLNLKANPEVEIQVGRDRQQGRARVVEPSDPTSTASGSSPTTTTATATPPTRKRPTGRYRWWSSPPPEADAREPRSFSQRFGGPPGGGAIGGGRGR